MERQGDQNEDLLNENSQQNIQSPSNLKNNIPKQQNPSKEEEQKKQVVQQLLDPIEELIKNNNILPLVAVIDKVELDRLIQDKPLICILASRFIPLKEVLRDRQIKWVHDNDKKTPLHYAIEANDVKAAAWCIQNGNPNQSDNFGNSPILDAIRLGHRSCFLLCLKNKYYDQRAPIVAAMFNRDWQIKVLSTMKFDIYTVRDEDNKNAFQRSLQYSSFDVAQFLVRNNQTIDIASYQNTTQSKGMIRSLKKMQKQQAKLTKITQFLRPLIFTVILLAGMAGFYLNQYLEPFNQFHHKPFLKNYLQYIFFGLFMGLIMVSTVFVNNFFSQSIKYSQSNTLGQLLNQPSYTTLDQICPLCLHFTQFQYVHCYSCGCCVQKFHFHSYTCINKSNEVLYIMGQMLYLYLVWMLRSQFDIFMVCNYIELVKMFNFGPYFLAGELQILYTHQLYYALLFFIVVFFTFWHQLFLCLKLFGMMFMRRKYSEVHRTQQFIHLFDVEKTGDNYFNKEKRVFNRGLLGGLGRAFRNLGLYFFLDN